MVKPVHISDVLLTIMEEFQQTYNSDELANCYIPSGIDGIDRIIKGFYDSEVSLIASMDSHEMQSLALSIVIDIAVNQKKSVCYFSMGKSKEDLVTEILAKDMGISSVRLKEANLQSNHWKKLMASLGKLDESEIAIDENSKTIESINEKLTKFVSENPLDIIVIDRLDLIQDADSDNSISEVFVQLQKVSTEFHVPVLVLFEVQNTDTQRLELADLSKYNNLDQLADPLLYLHINTSGDMVKELEVVKNTRGATGFCNLDVVKY